MQNVFLTECLLERKEWIVCYFWFRAVEKTPKANSTNSETRYQHVHLCLYVEGQIGMQKSSPARDTQDITLRVARLEDVPALTQLIVASVRGLQSAEYSEAQVEGAIGTIYGTDRMMIRDGTFFVVEHGSLLIGCGGWSRRKTAFGSDDSPVKDDALLDPLTDAAKIRGFFVHPSWARQGIGTRILMACEDAARDAGFTAFELVSTLTGVALYRRHGYVETERVNLTLPNAESYEAVRMKKG
jgi:GNAT superfamily N-acetyltransferase